MLVRGSRYPVRKTTAPLTAGLSSAVTMSGPVSWEDFMRRLVMSSVARARGHASADSEGAIGGAGGTQRGPAGTRHESEIRPACGQGGMPSYRESGVREARHALLRLMAVGQREVTAHGERGIEPWPAPRHRPERPGLRMRVARRDSREDRHWPPCVPPGGLLSAPSKRTRHVPLPYLGMVGDAVSIAPGSTGRATSLGYDRGAHRDA